MTWDAAFDVNDVSFLQAVSWFSERVPITEDAFLRNVEQARKQAFWIAGVTSADIIRDVHDSLRSALDKGTPFEEWQKEIGPALERAWLGQNLAEGKGARTETILRNWAQNAYGRARWDQMAAPAVRRVRPFLMFDATRDQRTSEICAACDSTVLPADHPWWKAHRPPLHHRCRSGIRSLTREKATRIGITATPTDIGPQDGFGSGDEWAGPDRKKFPRGAKPPAAPKPVPAPPPAPAPKPPRAQRPRKAKPGRPLESFTVGEHARRLELGPGIDEERARRILGALRPEDLRILRKRPLADLRLLALVEAEGGTLLNGQYFLQRADLETAAIRGAQTYGQKFRPGVTWSVSAAAQNEDRAVERTLIHEFGHHVHVSLGRVSDDVVREAYTRASRAGLFITAYAGQSHYEYFAESFAAYRYYPASLKRYDPNGFEMVEAVLRLHEQ